jgi:hypothetical protein
MLACSSTYDTYLEIQMSFDVADDAKQTHGMVDVLVLRKVHRWDLPLKVREIYSGISRRSVFCWAKRGVKIGGSLLPYPGEQQHA